MRETSLSRLVKRCVYPVQCGIFSGNMAESWEKQVSEMTVAMLKVALIERCLPTDGVKATLERFRR